MFCKHAFIDRWEYGELVRRGTHDSYTSYSTPWKWEVSWFGPRFDEEPKDGGSASHIEWLNALGNDGWEAYAATTVDDHGQSWANSRTRYMMKRRI
jgi:hypothetical protein